MEERKNPESTCCTCRTSSQDRQLFHFACPGDRVEIYEETIRKGLSRIGTKTVTASEAVDEGEAPSVEDSEREGRRIARRHARASSAAMVQAPTPSPAPDTAVVKKAAAHKLAKATSAGRTAKAKAAAKTTATKATVRTTSSKASAKPTKAASK